MSLPHIFDPCNVSKLHFSPTTGLQAVAVLQWLHATCPLSRRWRMPLTCQFRGIIRTCIFRVLIGLVQLPRVAVPSLSPRHELFAVFCRFRRASLRLPTCMRSAGGSTPPGLPSVPRFSDPARRLVSFTALGPPAARSSPIPRFTKVSIPESPWPQPVAPSAAAYHHHFIPTFSQLSDYCSPAGPRNWKAIEAM